MRILVFSPFYPPHIGGLESHSDAFNKYLSQKGARIFVFTPRLPESASETEMRHTDVEILRFPAFEPIHNYPVPKFWKIGFWKQWLFLLQSDCDIVVSRTRFFFPSLMAWHYARKRNLPWVHIEHGSDYAQFNGRIKTKLGELYDKTLGRFILRSADRIVGNSQASADFVQKISRRTDCQVIYRGANIEGIEKIEPNTHLKEKYKNKTIIAFIGRLIDGKGTRNLIAAIARLKRDDIITFIIGSGPVEARLKKKSSEYHLENHVV